MSEVALRPEQWVERATALLRDCYEGLRRASGYTLAPSFAIEPEFDTEEAAYFVMGVESGVFSIDDAGYAQSVVLPDPHRKGTQKRILELFWLRLGKRYLFREGVCQLATVSALALKYGWPINQLKMEPSIPEFPTIRWAVDILLKDAAGTVAACCEVKRNNLEFAQFLIGFRHCCERGPHRKDECRFAKNHPKYEFCIAIKPRYLMAASPGQQRSFRLGYDAGSITITEELDHLIPVAQEIIDRHH